MLKLLNRFVAIVFWFSVNFTSFCKMDQVGITTSNFAASNRCQGGTANKARWVITLALFLQNQRQQFRYRSMPTGPINRAYARTYPSTFACFNSAGIWNRLSLCCMATPIMLKADQSGCRRRNNCRLQQYNMGGFRRVLILAWQLPFARENRELSEVNFLKNNGQVATFHNFFDPNLLEMQNGFMAITAYLPFSYPICHQTLQKSEHFSDFAVLKYVERFSL